MKVYVGAVSGNSYKLKILLSLLKAPHEVEVIDISPKAMAHKQPSFLKLNPRGEVPVLVDGDVVLWDSAACLAYIARKHGGGQWLPSDPGTMAQVVGWLALSASEIQFGLQYGRRGVRQGRDLVEESFVLGSHIGASGGAAATVSGPSRGHADWERCLL